MALLTEVLKWTEEKLPVWQRDAVRRLFQQQAGLSDEDYIELYALLKAANNLPNPLGLIPQVLQEIHLPTASQVGETVILKTLRDLKYVNRIASGQKLHFSPTGMSVIYGGNGSGKSGYVRVMKRACRARDKSEPVHTDATDVTTSRKIPEAIFDIDLNGVSKSIHWKLDSEQPDELATFAVFDSYCARSYLTVEKNVAYLPYGLDVVQNLADQVLPELTRRLNDEIARLNIDHQPFQHLSGETEVGRLIAALSHETDLAEVQALGTLNEMEIARIKELDLALAESDPAAKEKELRLSVGRIKNLIEKMDSALAWVSDAAIKKLKEFDSATIVANQAEKQAADFLQSGENLLPGTGEKVWKELFDSARKFSTEIAYPEHEFPHIDDAICLLCQQPLTDGGGGRMERFEKYIQNDVAKSAAQQREKLKATKTKIEAANLSIGLDTSLIDWLKQFDDVFITIMHDFQTAIEARRTWMLNGLDFHVWESMPSIVENPRQRLRDLAARQLKSSRIFGRAVNEVKKKALMNEREELRARHNLSSCLNQLLVLLERMKLSKALKACEKDLKTRPISDKSKEFASSAVTATLENALNTEFNSLGIGHIKTKLQSRPDKGKIKHQLLLDLPMSNKLEQILSEGEQRAIALGSFLAELELANHSGGIVFDDPVSSLDHQRRGKFAKRLALESKRRQVLIFSHDVVFLHQLREACERVGAPPVSFCFLEVLGDYCGGVSPGLPWMHKSFGERIDALEKAQKYFENLPWPSAPTEALANEIVRQYSLFRATIERVVQDLVLNATVQRFRDYIEIKRLKKVLGLEEVEVNEIFRLNQRCNDVIEAHDPSSAKNEPPPTPQELKQDIEDLKKLIQKVKERHKLND